MANIFTNRGQQWAAERLAGTDANTGAYVGWGTGSGGTAASTGLVTPAPEARVVGTVSVAGTGSSAAYQVVATVVASAPRTITEVGNFETSGGADIIVYGDFTGIALAAGDGIEFTITIDPQ
jgi:hypothetical protein